MPDAALNKAVITILTSLGGIAIVAIAGFTLRSSIAQERTNGNIETINVQVGTLSANLNVMHARLERLEAKMYAIEFDLKLVSNEMKLIGSGR